MAIRLDPRMPPLDHSVLPYILERQVTQRPLKEFAVFADGTSWTYRETRDRAVRTAHALRRLGVKRDDRVLAWLPNGPVALRLWFGLSYLGAVFVPVNTAYRGRLLEHVIRNSNARLIVLHHDLVARLADVERGNLEVGVVPGASSEDIPGMHLLGEEALESSETETPLLDHEIAPWDTQTIVYTSGTTGPSKGVLSSYMHCYATAISTQALSESDRWLLAFPMFHIAGTVPLYRMLIEGGSVYFSPGFDTNAFWSTVRESQATATVLVGAMVSFLIRQPESPMDRDHTLRNVTIAPYNDLALRFGERFGCDIYTHFNMTEISMPLVSVANPRSLGGCGRPRPGVTVRVVDEHDCEVPAGTVGELVVRTDCPWAMNHGYNANAEATASAWRNGWFHTGDAFRVAEDGEFFFVDRIKDAIRRRGENISTFEIEAEILAHPKVRDVAAIGVPSELGEDEVLVAVVLEQGATLEPVELMQFLVRRMAHFMVPRYIRFMEQLPKTPTQKAQKYLLREMGLQGDVWDRERAGIVVKRQRLS